MKTYVFLSVMCMSAFSCGSKKPVVEATSHDTTVITLSNGTATTPSHDTVVTQPDPVQNVAGKTIGKVSHQFRSGGCSTVIVVAAPDGEMILIPKDPLKSEFDVDGMQIHFNYHTLRMPQPAGCSKGMPAEITDVSK